jgi:hypothetical protein
MTKLVKLFTALRARLKTACFAHTMYLCILFDRQNIQRLFTYIATTRNGDKSGVCS